jgi:hypothetical protein
MSITPKSESIGAAGKVASFGSKIAEAIAPVVSEHLIEKIETEQKEKRKKIKD